ncbi:MAG: methyltransferase domain-containing protein [Candidatus Omnitrophica bacterium]|nr:methyltransferase domain-containing protein [Candidatus Omnitrophota bacterium]
MAHAGALTISIDLELAWGVCDVLLTPQAREALGRERAIVTRLLDLFAAYDVRATWAVVGHLMATECRWTGQQAHPEIVRWSQAVPPRDWFFQHPPQDQLNDPLWYAHDLISLIQQATPPQEIGSHSFCHLPYDERRVPRETVWADLSAARALHSERGLPFNAFVFPRNVEGYHALLRAAGITVYRGKTARWYERIPIRPVRRALHLASYGLPICPRTVRPMVDAHGLLNVPDSLLLMGRRGLRRLIPPAVLRWKGLMALDRATARGEVFHLWFHPSNFAEQSDVPFRILEAWLKRAHALRAEGRLHVMAMGDYASLDPSWDRDVARIRERAVAVHDTGVEQFIEWYDTMAVDPYASAFAYGRQEVITCLRDTLGELPQGSRILDAGCGTGDQVRLVSQWGFQVAGVEPSATMRRIAQQRNPGQRIQDGLVGSLPFPDASFDAVIAIEVLRYLHRTDILAAYHEVLRVLKPGGRFFFTMVNRYALDAFALYDGIKRWRRAVRPHAEPPVHCEFVTPGQVVRDVQRAGWGSVSVQGRLILPVRMLYKLHEGFGARCARLLHPCDRWLGRQRWAVSLAGHLIVVGRRPPEK